MRSAEKSSAAILFGLSVLVGAWAPGCSQSTKTPCENGEVGWDCNTAPFGCVIAQPVPVCASSQADAEARAIVKAVTMRHLPGTPPSASCHPNRENFIYDQAAAPSFMPQTLGGSCSADPGDDFCTACAKSVCCNDYLSCGADANCTCLVDCLAPGNTLDACTATCGALGAVASSTAACLTGSCPAECGGSTGSGMCGSTSSSSGSGGGGGGGGAPTCTPGPMGPGENCFSDADCGSCSCDAQTMTCF